MSLKANASKVRETALNLENIPKSKFTRPFSIKYGPWETTGAWWKTHKWEQLQLHVCHGLKLWSTTLAWAWLRIRRSWFHVYCWFSFYFFPLFGALWHPRADSLRTQCERKLENVFSVWYPPASLSATPTTEQNLPQVAPGILNHHIRKREEQTTSFSLCGNNEFACHEAVRDCFSARRGVWGKSTQEHLPIPNYQRSEVRINRRTGSPHNGAHLLSGSARQGVYLPLGFREPVDRQMARVLRDPDRDWGWGRGMFGSGAVWKIYREEKSIEVTKEWSHPVCPYDRSFNSYEKNLRSIGDAWYNSYPVLSFASTE